jgi:hypothetical protein
MSFTFDLYSELVDAREELLLYDQSPLALQPMTDVVYLQRQRETFMWDMCSKLARLPLPIVRPQTRP